jgi:acetoacetyl-CoA synthetase
MLTDAPQPASGEIAPAPSSTDAPPLSAEQAHEAAVRLFRSTRAGLAWTRAQGAEAAARVRATACVPMKAGAEEQPPIFMLPGAGGSVLQLGPIAAALPIPAPAYAIRPRGLVDGETPCRTIAEMAEYSIRAIRSVRPDEPYLLLGYSAGGLLALEIAQQLLGSGHDVSLVVLLDTYPGKKFWPLRCHAAILSRRTVHAVWSMCRIRPSALMTEVSRRLRSLCVYLADSGVKALPPSPLVPQGSDAASRRVYLATYAAGEAYRPCRYGGEVLFIQAGDIANLAPRSPAHVWGRVLPRLETRQAPGSHGLMVETSAAKVAALVGEYWRKVLTVTPSPRTHDAPSRSRPVAGELVEL